MLVDALDGSVALLLSAHQEAKNRIVCDLANLRVDLNDRDQYGCDRDNDLGAAATTRAEGGAASSVAAVNKAYEYLGATLDFYQNTFGLDSFNGRGGQVSATVRACQVLITGFSIPCPYPNAF